tara:strand:+ start:1721 stop:2224 length:504 start_codon:yes stop_codon:yes gene_type:complete
MKINFKKHNFDLYSSLLNLSRNIFFYEKVQLKDNFETRIYLMFIHFSIMMIITKKKGQKFDQISYDQLFHSIENNLRELGIGDVSVNKKMKDFNKILYDILLKIENKSTVNSEFNLNYELISKYFSELNDPNNEKFRQLANYIGKFHNFCFELPLNNMLNNINKFKF